MNEIKIDINFFNSLYLNANCKVNIIHASYWENSTMKKTTTFLAFVLITFIAAAQVPQTVIVEHYTNSKCGICANRNPAFYNLLENYPDVIHIAFHPSSPYSTCIFSQHNPAENDARTNFYGIYGGTPRAVVQGDVIPPGSQLLTSEQLDSKLGNQSDFDINFNHYFGEGDTVWVKVTIHKVGNSTSGALKFYGFLAEKLIEYSAPNGEDMHHDVFRKVAIEQSVNLQNVGDSVILQAYYFTHTDWNQEEIYAVGVLQKTSDKSIVQAAQSGFAEEMTGIYNRKKDLSNLIYPNPVKHQFTIAPRYINDFEKAELYNLFGVLIKEIDLSGFTNVSELASGHYFVVFMGKDGQAYTSRIIKQ